MVSVHVIICAVHLKTVTSDIYTLTTAMYCADPRLPDRSIHQIMVFLEKQIDGIVVLAASFLGFPRIKRSYTYNPEVVYSHGRMPHMHLSGQGNICV